MRGDCGAKRPLVGNRPTLRVRPVRAIVNAAVRGRLAGAGCGGRRLLPDETESFSGASNFGPVLVPDVQNYSPETHGKPRLL